MSVSLPLMAMQSGDLPVNSFDQKVTESLGHDLDGLSLDTVQVNIGLRCNLACHHCHVESSPSRTEEMTWETMQEVLAAARRAGSSKLDITGGAPEMHPHLKKFIDAGIAQGLSVMVRTNLTIMLQKEYADFPAFFADRKVHLVASLPCYLQVNVDKQRGRHVYHDSIEVIQSLNALGFGKDDSGLELDLVYNPGGPSLPPSQPGLEKDYRRELHRQFDIHFNHLFTITNMPIGRFQHDLQRDGKAMAYNQLLLSAYNSQTLEPLMCRHQIHVGYDGRLYDCDFNYAIAMPVNGDTRYVRDLDPQTYRTRRIATGEHCFGCTAGCGSSCTGALA